MNTPRHTADDIAPPVRLSSAPRPTSVSAAKRCVEVATLPIRYLATIGWIGATLSLDKIKHRVRQRWTDYMDDWCADITHRHGDEYGIGAETRRERHARRQHTKTERDAARRRAREQG